MIDNILLVLLLLLLTAKITGAIFERFGFDSSLAELLTGIFFGVSFLNIIHADSIEAFAIIGSVLILFIAGMKQNEIEDVAKDKSAITLAALLLLITTALMTIIFFFLSKFFGINLNFIQSLILGLAFAIVDIGVPAKILISKGIIALPCGKVAMRAAILNIIFGLTLFTIFSIFIQKNANDIFFKFGGIILFLAITVLMLWGFSKLAKHIIKLHISEAEISLAIILVLAFAYFSETIGFSSVLGAFIAGIIITKLPFSETRSFSDKIKSLSFGLFIPLFFIWFGLEINLKDIWQNIWISLIIFVSYITIRFLITYIFLKIKKQERIMTVSVSMLSVDVESLVILLVALNIGIFHDNTPLNLFAPSVFLSTLLIVISITIISRIEKYKKEKEQKVIAIPSKTP